MVEMLIDPSIPANKASGMKECVMEKVVKSLEHHDESLESSLAV